MVSPSTRAVTGFICTAFTHSCAYSLVFVALSRGFWRPNQTTSTVLSRRSPAVTITESGAMLLSWFTDVASGDELVGDDAAPAVGARPGQDRIRTKDPGRGDANSEEECRQVGDASAEARGAEHEGQTGQDGAPALEGLRQARYTAPAPTGGAVNQILLLQEEDPSEPEG